MSKARALQRIPTGAWRLLVETCVNRGVDLPGAALYGATVLPVIDAREAAVAAYQRDAAERYPWIGAADGWPGNNTYCAIWNDNKPGPDQVVARALAVAQGHDITYAMGTSGPRWLASTFDPEGDGADCSDFVSYCIGRRKAGGLDWTNDRGQRLWLHTGSIVTDARGDNKLFCDIGDPVAPCIASYPDRNGKQGHTGVIVSVHGGALRGVDCSYTQHKRTGDAVKVRDLSWFKRKAGVVFCAPVWWTT